MTGAVDPKHIVISIILIYYIIYIHDIWYMIYDIWYMIYSYVSYIYIYVWIIKLSSYIIISSYIPTIPHFLSSSLPNKNTRTTMKTYRWRHRKPARQPSHPIWRTCWKSCCALQRSPLLIPHLHTFAKWKITFGINLVGDFNPSEKYESQLGWWHSQYIWKKKKFQTTNHWS